MNNFTPELELLFEVSQYKSSPPVIKELWDKGLDQEYLYNLSVANGVLPLLYKELSKYPQYKLIDKFRVEQQSIAKQNFFMTAQLLQVIYFLKRLDVEIIPIKGALLSENAYDDFSLRPYSDLDILVRIEDLDMVVDLLLSLGFKSESDLKALKHEFILKKFSDIGFVHEKSSIIIEVHWQLIKTCRASLSNINHLFDSARSTHLHGISVHSLALEEEFLYLCIHAAKHRFERVEWMNDLHLLAHKYAKVYDWIKLRRLAQDEFYLSAYLLALALLDALYRPLELDSETKKLLASHKIKDLVSKVINLHKNDYILDDKKVGIRLKELRFAIYLEDSYQRKLGIILSTIFPLYKDDILLGPKLNKIFSPLYYLYRIYRKLIKK